FQWNDHASTAIAAAEGLSAGTYEVIGTDARNCVVSFQVVIVDNPDPELNLVEIHPSACGRALGFASVQASGGTPPYSYAWNDGAHQTTPSATHLLYGFYTVTAYDANGCPTNTLNVEVEEIEDLEIIVSEIQNAGCFEGSDGMVRVSVVNGVAPFKFSVDGGIEQTDNEFAGLGVGTHFLKVTDANFCTDETEVIIQAPDELRFAGVSKYNPLCFGVCDGEISVLVAGGVGPYNYLWDTSDITKSVTELCPGNYSVTVTDANGCSVSTTIEILQPAKIHGAGIPEKLIICEGNSVEVDAGLWINYEWTGNNFKSFNRKINIHNPGDYYLQVVSPEGCIVLDTVTLELSNEILKAKALVPSKAFIGDSVEVIDVSWPPADNIEWFLPENVNLLEQGDDRILIKFMEAGIYVVGMDATSGLCQDYVEYEIEIMEGEAVDEGGRLGYEAVIESFSLFPNPNNGRFTAIVGLYRNADITLRVVDNVRSRIIREEDYAGKKEYEIEFSFDDLPGGVYTLNLEVEGEMKNLRFVVN
ncbi:MAG TPA: SprB repeat-containing protein, partial [Cyclobacteriaceae bacterium]